MVEEAEGCIGEETRPLIGELYEQIAQGEGWGYYAEKYAALRPDDNISWPTRG